MKNTKVSIRLPVDLKHKLIRDSIIMEFPNISAYLCELIEVGLPKCKSEAERIQKANDDQMILLERILETVNNLEKRTYVTYKVAAHVLARSFFIKSGVIPEHEIAETNSLIETEVKNFEKRFRRN